MPPSTTKTCDLAVLDMSCHTFKEPVLDVLWSMLDDLSPLAWCLPDISCLIGVPSWKVLPVSWFPLLLSITIYLAVNFFHFSPLGLYESVCI